MKVQLLLILLLSVAVNAQNFPSVEDGEGVSLTKAEKAVMKKARDAKKYDYILISKYIDSEYIAKAVVKIAKLEKQIIALKKRQKKTGISQKAVAKYSKEIAHLTALLDAEKLWAVYNDAYVLYYKAYNSKERKRASELGGIMKDIQKKYKTLTDESFPLITSLFYSKYKKQLVKLRKKYLN